MDLAHHADRTQPRINEKKTQIPNIENIFCKIASHPEPCSAIKIQFSMPLIWLTHVFKSKDFNHLEDWQSAFGCLITKTFSWWLRKYWKKSSYLVKHCENNNLARNCKQVYAVEMECFSSNLYINYVIKAPSLNYLFLQFILVPMPFTFPMHNSPRSACTFLRNMGALSTEVQVSGHPITLLDFLYCLVIEVIIGGEQSRIDLKM